MFERVLVPLDGSKVGEAALPVISQLVGKLAPGSRVEVTLIGVITLLRHWVVVGEASAPVSYTEEELKIIKERVSDYLIKVGESMKTPGSLLILSSVPVTPPMKFLKPPRKLKRI